MANQLAALFDHPLPPIAPSETDVVQGSSVLKGHTPSVVDAVVTDPGLREELLSGERGRRLIKRAPRVHRWTPSRLVGTDLVVGVNEAIDLAL